MSVLSKRSIIGVLLAIIYPFGGLYYSIKYIHWKDSEKVFFLFCIYFGLAFIYYPEGAGILGEGADSERYAVYLVNAHNMQNISLDNYLQIRGERADYYASFLLYIVSRFTGNPQMFFCVVAIIMGFFYAKVSWMVIKFCKSQNVVVKLFIIFLMLVAPIWKINGVRWWTALYVFLYGMYFFSFYKKKIHLLWCVLAVLIHYTFLYPLAIIVISFFLSSRKLWPYVILFLGVNLLSGFDVSALEGLLSKMLPDIYAENTIGYLTFEYKATRNWFADSGKFITIYMNIYLVLLFYFKGRKKIENTPFLRKIFVLSLLIASLCLVINMAPWGGRFLDLGNYCLYASFCFALSNDNIRLHAKKWINCVLPFLLYVILFQIREGFYAIGIVNLLFGNFFTVFFTNDNYPIINYINSLF